MYASFRKWRDLCVVAANTASTNFHKKLFFVIVEMPGGRGVLRPLALKHTCIQCALALGTEKGFI
jgi:hypothetical protein